MKSSGSLRFFDKKIAQKIAQYDGLCRKMQTAQLNDNLLYIEVRKLRAQIFDFHYNSMANDIAQATYKSFDQGKIDDFMKLNPPLLNYDRITFNQYVELARSRFLGRDVRSADTLLDRSIELIVTQTKFLKLCQFSQRSGYHPPE